jgi:uncharacterized Zn-binding protein involved in type VI secretion
MPGAVRKQQDVAGGPVITGSSNVYVNGKPMVRKGDLVASHGKKPHSGVVKMVQGSGTVFCNGRPACKKGNVASCGHKVSGS